MIELRRKEAAQNASRCSTTRRASRRATGISVMGTSPGNIDPEIVPYYLLLIGPPDLIPFEFQYLLGVEYAVGRLAFDKAEDYEPYARSTMAYEAARSVPNAKEIAYWGTRHLGDPATNLSASMLIDPLANGVPGSAGSLKRAINADVGYGRNAEPWRRCDQGEPAAGAARSEAPRDAVHSLARHGVPVRPGRAGRHPGCAAVPGLAGLRQREAEHFLAAADIADDANVNGLVALLFACFGAGTPDADQFLMDLSQAGTAPPLAPQPFIAALPRRLLAHPKGSALAVIGHIDRAWGFSIQARQGVRAADRAPSATASALS